MDIESRNKTKELQTIITRMPLHVFCAMALPEMGVRWREVAQAVRNARLPMQPASVARVICKHITKSLTEEEIQDIVARLKLKVVATSPRMWYVFKLSEKTTNEPVNISLSKIPLRIIKVLQKNKKGMKPEVQTVHLDDLIYISVQLVSAKKEGSVLYCAHPPGLPVVMVSGTGMVGLLRAVVEGLGYKKYINANLYGRDIPSLLRIQDDAYTANADHLTEVPEYDPKPHVTKSAKTTIVDFTHKSYDEKYVDQLLGPNPPVITNFKFKTSRQFFDPTLLDGTMNVRINLKSDNIASSLKSLVTIGALAPTSELFQIFHKLKSNNLTYNREDSE